MNYTVKKQVRLQKVCKEWNKLYEDLMNREHPSNEQVIRALTIKKCAEGIRKHFKPGTMRVIKFRGKYKDKEIISLFEKGLSISDISKKLDIPWSSVNYRIKSKILSQS